MTDPEPIFTLHPAPCPGLTIEKIRAAKAMLENYDAELIAAETEKRLKEQRKAFDEYICKLIVDGEVTP
jgi:hypothetical protein